MVEELPYSVDVDFRIAPLGQSRSLSPHVAKQVRLPKNGDVICPLKKEPRATKEEVHFGMVFGFVVEKNTDLPAGDPRRKFKGRVVFQGNKVKNQNWENAVCADLGS